MVFIPTAQPTSVVPDVQIFFHGQLLLRSEDGKTCEVGVNPLATDHILSVEVRTKTSGEPDLINMRHFGPLHFRQPGMTIAIDPPQVPFAFKCVTSNPIDHEAGTGAPPEDFRWILNFEGNLFHGRELNPSVFGSQNVIKMQDGQFFFETARRADMQLGFDRTGGGLGPKTLRGIGAIASASVFLSGTQSVVLTWHDGSRERVLTLTKADHVTYEIYIENTPLFVQVNPGDLSSFEELVHFYKVIPVSEVPANLRFKLTPRPLMAEGDKGSPTIPCQVMVLDGP